MKGRGISNPKGFCINLENKINDSIAPQPDYSIKIEDNNIVVFKVEDGISKPYMYKSKAYKRNDSATIEVDPVELTRLILEGKNLNYEELKSEQQELTFLSLKRAFEEKAGVEYFTNFKRKAHYFSGGMDSDNIIIGYVLYCNIPYFIV